MGEGSRGEHIFHMNQKADLDTRNPADLDPPHGYSTDEGPIGDGLNEDDEATRHQWKVAAEIRQNFPTPNEKQQAKKLHRETTSALADVREITDEIIKKAPSAKQKYLIRDIPSVIVDHDLLHPIDVHAPTEEDVRKKIKEQFSQGGQEKALKRQQTRDLQNSQTPEKIRLPQTRDTLINIIEQTFTDSELSRVLLSLGYDETSWKELPIKRLDELHEKIVEKLRLDQTLEAEIAGTLKNNITEIIKKIGRENLIFKFSVPELIDEEWKNLPQNKLQKLYDTLTDIQTKIKSGYFEEQAQRQEEERTIAREISAREKDIEAYVKDNFDAPLAESDKLIAQAEKQEEDAFFEKQAQRQEEEREVARAKLAREREEVNAYVRDHFDKPLEESERLLNEQKKAEEPGTEPTIRVEPTDPSSIYKLGAKELETHPGRFDLLNESEKDKKILQQWREQIPQMSLETLKANAKHAFDIDLNDQTQEGLTKVAELVNLGTVRGEIFRMLYNKFVEITTRQKGIKNEERPIQTEQRAPDEAHKIELIKKEINQGETQMRLLIEQVSPYLTAPQKFEMQQIYREMLQAQRQAEWTKLLEVTERAINTLKRFQSIYEELQQRGALKTSTPPITTKPQGLFSRIKSFFGGSKK